MNTLTNKTAYITGGSKGIGLGIAQALLNEGMNVAISSRHLEAAQQAAATLNAGNLVLPLQSDVSVMNDEVNAVQQIIERFGALDVLVANAGVGHFAPIDELTEQQWHETINTNLTGVFNSVKASVGAIKKTQGYIITIASLAGTNFFEKASAYNA
ncbi:MAG: SDR family NAD(P)-dependent oxidoreductase, partial [Dinghuibacter sp.]|nr:SDR family NAD(P)-dependent oxidoreductase [Dinghuibacter sp.]